MTTATLNDGAAGGTFDPGGPSSSGSGRLSSIWNGDPVKIAAVLSQRTRFWPDDAIDNDGEAVICVFVRCLKGMIEASTGRSVGILEWIRNDFKRHLTVGVSFDN